MDIALLTTFLSPFLPHLLKLGGEATAKVTETVSEKFGEAAWAKAQKIWTKLQPKLEEHEDLNIAAKQAATKPDSKARQDFFQEELETLLTNNPDLEKAIAQIMNESASGNLGQVTQSVGKVDGQVIGQVSGGQSIGQINAEKVIGEVSGDVEGGIHL